MNTEVIGGIEIFRPRLETELELREAVSAHLRSEYGVGRYTDKDGPDGRLPPGPAASQANLLH